jgi:hypothetical protein
MNNKLKNEHNQTNITGVKHLLLKNIKIYKSNMNWFEPPESKDTSLSFPRRRETVGIQEETWVPLSIANLDKLSRMSELASFELLEVNFNEDGKYVCNFPRSDQKRKSS